MRTSSPLSRAALISIAMAVAGAASGAPRTLDTGRNIVAVSAALSGEGGRTALTLTLSGSVGASAFVLDHPERAIVDMPEVNCQIAADPGQRGGLVAGLRCGRSGPGRARIVVDLAGPATVSQPVVSAGPVAGTWLLRLDLARADRETFRRAAAIGAPDIITTTGSVAPIRERPDVRPVVALDAGHGGDDPGTRSGTGLEEKNLTLTFVRELRDRLVRSGRYRVMLTRDEDVFVALDERVRRAREAGAALFLSVHADSISRPSIRGATIYTGAERASDPDAAKLADRENEADMGAGLAGSGEPGEVAGILHDLTQRETRDFSRRLAGHLHDRLAPVTRFTSEPHREAGFRVLRAPDIPSALLELGYLSNARDTELMFSEPWRRRSADAVSDAIDRFFARATQASAAVSP